MVMSKKTKIVEIPKVEWEKVPVRLVGKTPLIVNNFDEKTKQQMADAQQGTARNARAPKNPDELYNRARLRDGKGKDCVRALWIKCAGVAAARFVEGLQMTKLRGAFYVEGDMIPLNYKKVEMRCDSVRNANGGADLRYRPEYTEWYVDIVVSYRKDTITPDSVFNLLNNAGQSIGLCERRPGQNGDTFGMFEVASGGAAPKKRGKRAQ